MLNLEKDDLWTSIKTSFQIEFGMQSYNAWLSKLNLVSLNSNEITMSVETKFIKEWIIKNFFDGKRKKIDNKYIWLKKGIKQILNEKFNIKSVEIIVEKSINQQSNKIDADKNLDNIKSISKYDNLYAIGIELNPLYTFEKYVVGESNQSAFLIANEIIMNNNTLGFDMNPFFIHSEVGLGKTHLMQAMAFELKNKYSNKNVIYLSAERFMYLFVQSLKNKNIDRFKEQFRNIDFLFIDDIQFLAGKDKTQKEFFYTFNTLLNDNKKIILACDRCPKNLENIEEQLKSKMSAGIVIDILKPDYEMKLKLAKKKAQIFELICDEEIFDYIANNIHTTNRDIEGIIKNLLIKQKLSNENINLDFVKKYLGNNILYNKKSITIELIQQKVAEYYKITKNEILSNQRDRKFSFPRQIAFYLSKKLTDKGYTDIGREFGNKNHATVLFAYNKIEKTLQNDNKLLKSINELKSILRNI